ncbi:winged helix-turn-helix transcriptional regulator [Photobacterium nomapromontoriensis]|uniref:winged helix-turn-helix transcriptional regulator n=1 Tax=Photobacterium nomapromontoriensis TaxID=2910237 RepID=UPI003D0AF51D
MKRTRYKSYSYEGCPVEASLELFGGKGKGVILYHLLGGTLRFNELKRLLVTVTQRMLTKQLRELECVGLVHREVYAEVPPKVEYSLTEMGRSLEPILLALKVWGEQHALPVIMEKQAQMEQDVDVEE